MVIETHLAYATGGGTEGQVKWFLRAKPLELISSISAALKGSIKRNYGGSLSVS